MMRWVDEEDLKMIVDVCIVVIGRVDIVWT